MIGYNGRIEQVAFGLSPYYAGNVLYQFSFPQTVPAQEVTVPSRQYGILSYPKKGTTFIIRGGIAHNAFDDRPLIDVDPQNFVEGGVQIYSENTYVRANPDQIKLKVRFDSNKELFLNMQNGLIQIQTAVWGLKLNAQGLMAKKDLDSEDYMAMYTPLVSILDNIASFLSSFQQWAAEHKHDISGSPPITPPPPASYFTSGYNSDKILMKTETQ
jgi:hypothetical protein